MNITEEEKIYYFECVAKVARELIEKGLTIDEAVQKAPEEYERRQKQLDQLLTDDSFKNKFIESIKQICK